MSESDIRAKVVTLLRPLDAISVENPAYPGTPDVNFIEGWIELKYEKRWPVRGGILRLPHFTQQQRVWLTRRWTRGGNVSLLLVVHGEWFLFDGATAAKVVGKVGREELVSHCRNHWGKAPEKQEFIQCVLAISPPVKSSS